jgi:hypothetical protein
MQNKIEASDAAADIEVQIAEIIKKLDGKLFAWLLITQQYVFPCEAVLHNTRENFICDLADAMTCHCFVAAIYNQGRRLSSIEIQPLADGFFGRFIQPLLADVA